MLKKKSQRVRNRTEMNTPLCKQRQVQVFIKVLIYWNSNGTKPTAKLMEIFLAVAANAHLR